MGLSLRLFFVLVAGSGLTCRMASAFDLSVLGGVNGTFATTTPAVATAASPTPAASLAMGFGNFEANFMYAPRAYTFTGITETEQRFTLVTYWRIQASIWDFLIGSYGSFGIGNLTLSNGTSSSYAAAGQNPVDYGLAAGIGVGIPLSDSIKLLVRTQGFLGLGNGFTIPLVSLNYKDLQALTGIRFVF
jgi:hypothetical protein